MCMFLYKWLLCMQVDKYDIYNIRLSYQQINQRGNEKEKKRKFIIKVISHWQKTIFYA